MEASPGRGLPLQQHIKIGLGIFALYGMLYLGAQRIFLFHEPTLVPFTTWDHAIGLSSGWVWIYLLAYPYVPLAFFSLQDAEHIYGYARSYIWLTVGSVAIFTLYPTVLPRAPYPTDHSFSGQTLEWLRTLDAPTNCLPSLHVATSILSSWWLWCQRRLHGIIGFIFTLLVIWSTLALKQHVLWDAVGGIVAAVTAITASYWRGIKLVR